MRSLRKRYYRNKLIVETDFAQGPGWLLDLGRGEDSSPSFIVYKYKTERAEVDFVEMFELSDRVLIPPQDPELMRSVRLPKQFGGYKSVSNLLQQIDAILSRCLDLDAQHRFILDCFVLSTWMIDRLLLAPYIALVGLPQSGKTTALKALHLLCRKSIITSDITPAALYRACDRLMPTLFIDETATAGQRRSLFHLLRSGNTPDSIAFRESQSYRTFCAKVITWTELPDDAALNSRCIIIPMLESSRSDLLRTTDPEIVAAADHLQGQLLQYRCRNYHTLQLPQIPGTEKLRSRNRDLYEALALGIGEDLESCVRLLGCMTQQSTLHTQSLAPNQFAILDALFQQIHAHPDQGTFALQDLAKDSNISLKRTGERFQVNSKGVRAVLTTFGFHNRTRKSSGWVVWLDRSARKRIHELISLHGAGDLDDRPPAEKGAEACEFCKASETLNPDIPPANEAKIEPSANQQPPNESDSSTA